VYLLNRGNNREFEYLGAKYIICDAHNPQEMKEKIGEMYFDVVANFICFNIDHVKADVELFAGNIGQYFFISSCTVYQKPCFSTPITTDTPLKNPYSQYAQGKIACEMYLLGQYREIDFPVTIVRPSHTYGEKKLIVGPLAGWNIPHWTLVDRILKGEPIIVHGTGRSLWTVTHSDDFAYAFCGLMGNYKAIGHQFHITNDEAMTWDIIMMHYGQVLGIKTNIVHIPVDFIAKVCPEKKDAIYGDMIENGVFDISKIQKFVPGFRTRVPLRDGLARSIKWYFEHPDEMIVSEADNALTNKLIAAWENCKW
jgi:nucleoside-diphosphate-sugar epimerase